MRFKLIAAVADCEFKRKKPFRGFSRPAKMITPASIFSFAVVTNYKNKAKTCISQVTFLLTDSEILLYIRGYLHQNLTF
jgi:hypothetical protein